VRRESPVAAAIGDAFLFREDCLFSESRERTTCIEHVIAEPGATNVELGIRLVWKHSYGAYCVHRAAFSLALGTSATLDRQVSTIFAKGERRLVEVTTPRASDWSRR
jgi:hypothetical protein